jgi:hypothetical protein
MQCHYDLDGNMSMAVEAVGGFERAPQPRVALDEIISAPFQAV